LLAAGLVAVVYNLLWGLPFLEFFQLSNYQKGAGRFQDLNFQDFLTFLNPFIQGHPLGRDYHGPHYWVSTYFMGLPTLCLLAWGAYRRLYAKVFWIPVLLWLGLSLGVLGLGKILKFFLPGYALVIHSGFWISLLALWVAWLAMESFESFMGSGADFQGKKVWLLATLLLYGLAATLGQPLTWEFILSGLLLVLALIGESSGWKALWVVGALGFSLGTAAVSLNILLPDSYYQTKPDLLASLGQPGRLFFTPPLMGRASKLEGVSMPQAYEGAKQALYPNWPLAWGLEEAPIYNTFQLKSSFAWTFTSFQYSLDHSRKVLDYLQVRYLFGKNIFEGGQALIPLSPQGEASLNPHALPKWFTVRRARMAGTSVEDDFILASAKRLDYSRDSFVANPALAGRYRIRPPVQEIRQPGRPTRLDLGIPGKGKALLVSSETNYPGWRYKEGDRWLPVETVNHAFRGVVLEEGTGHVTMAFEPATFRLGLFAALLMMGLWGILILRRFRK
jgi:hypothetical protein